MPTQRCTVHNQGKKAKIRQPEKKISLPYNWQFFGIGLFFAVLAALYYNNEIGTSGAPPIPRQQRSQDDLSLGDEAIFTVIDIPGKGKGVIAARDIKQGEVILREKPLFVVPRNINSSPTALIMAKLENLSLQEREAFVNLSYVNLPEGLEPNEHPEEVALAIFQTNAVSAGESVGIFPRMARLNHGCSSAFNVVYSWRDATNFLIVHALKDIRRGQELLTTYTNSKRPRDERRAFLNDQYGFHCTCDVCSLPKELSKASDTRLTTISMLYDKFASWANEKVDGVEAINCIRKIWDIEEEEGYWSERGQLAADATWVAASHSDASATQAWARTATEWFSYEIGADTPQVREMRRVLDRPQSHRAWGTRQALAVGGPGKTRYV